jgi:hypothetical protein
MFNIFDIGSISIMLVAAASDTYTYLDEVWTSWENVLQSYVLQSFSYTHWLLQEMELVQKGSPAGCIKYRAALDRPVISTEPAYI